MKFLKFALVLAAVFAIAAGCAHKKMAYTQYHAKDFQWHKNTIWIKVHWNILHPDKDTVVADGFVEPFNQMNGVHHVRLELVGLDADGKAVNSVEGLPADNNIVSPFDTSHFRIEMKLNGKEEDFTIRGNYYHYVAGRQPTFSAQDLDWIPLNSDEEP